MNCERTRKVLPFLHDGSLAPEVAHEAGEHVERCEECREEYARLSRTMRLVRTTFDEGLPADSDVVFRDAVMTKIRHRRRERTIVSWALPAAASIFLAASITSYTALHTGGGMNHLSSATYSTGQQTETATAEETELAAMYHYADVSVYDVLNNLGDDVLETGADLDEVGE